MVPYADDGAAAARRSYTPSCRVVLIMQCRILHAGRLRMQLCVRLRLFAFVCLFVCLSDCLCVCACVCLPGRFAGRNTELYTSPSANNGGVPVRVCVCVCVCVSSRYGALRLPLPNFLKDVSNHAEGHPYTRGDKVRARCVRAVGVLCWGGV